MESMERTGPRMRERQLVALAISALVVGLGVWLQIAPPRLRANDLSRWNTVWTLVHSGSYVIDDFPMGKTIDHVRREVDGAPHFFSSKPAIMATWVAGVYYPLFRLGLPLDRRGTGIVLIVVNLLPFGLFLWFYWGYLERSGASDWSRRTCFAVAALGTYLTGYLSVLNNHVFAAICVFFASLLYWHIVFLGDDGRARFAWFGLAAGLAVAHEIPSALLVGPMLLALLPKSPRRVVAFALPAFALPVCALFGAEYAATRDPLPNYVHAFLGRSYTHYPGSYWKNPSPFDRRWDPIPVRAFQMSFGHHGIFSLTPVLLPCLVPAARALRHLRESREARTVTGLSVASAATFLLYLFATHNYGGVAHGFRWMFWLIPPWLMVLPRALDSPCFERPARRLLLAPLFAISVYSALTCLSRPWGPSWLEILMQR
jgi:hypothetical protein